MPVFSGKFFEVLIGARPEPMWQLLSKVGLLYTLEPIFTIIFVINMNGIWEKVMTSLRAQIFQRVLIQKVESFDRYKVGELTALLTTDLGSLRNIVSENISRDRGFRAISEVIGTLCLLFALSPQLAPVLGILMLSVSALVAVYKRTTFSVFKAHGAAQATIADCVTETFAAIRTVRSFGGEKHQMSVFGRQYEKSGITLGLFKSINESITRVAVYVSLMALYCLGGSKVKAGKLAVGTMVSFIGYTFTLTFAVQGVVNTFGDLRGAFAAVERINSVLSGAEIDKALAVALDKDLKRRKLHDPNLEHLLLSSNGAAQSSNVGYMSSLKSASDVLKLAESGDIHLEDTFGAEHRPIVEFALDNVQKLKLLKLRAEKLKAQQQEQGLHTATPNSQPNDRVSRAGSIANSNSRKRKSRDGDSSLIKNERSKGTVVEESKKTQEGSKRGKKNSFSSDKQLKKQLSDHRKGRDAGGPVKEKDRTDSGMQRKRSAVHDQPEGNIDGSRNRKRRKKKDPVGRDAVDKLDMLIEQYRNKFTGGSSATPDDKKQGSKNLKRWFES